jgi:hypothetical protein
MSYTIHNTDEMLSDLKEAYQNKKPFTVSSFGDAEQIFLGCPELYQTPNLETYLHINGLRLGMDKLKKEIISLISENDYIYTHSWSHKEEDLRLNSPSWDWARFFYISNEILDYYKIDGVKLLTDLPRRYEIVADGSLFNILEGAKILLVGFHAPAVEERMKNPAFVKHYEKMNLHKIKVVGSIGCSEFRNVGDEVYDMVEKAKNIDYDVALVGMGISSNYFIPTMKLQGKSAINIGHVMTAFAGKGDNRRMIINQFDYEI